MSPPIITQDSFDALLSWLGPTREEAGRKYETIRSRLIQLFRRKGALDAEGLADITLNRVMSKLTQIVPTYVGDPAHYFVAVARLVHLESLNPKEIATDEFPTLIAHEPRQSAALECLQKCLQTLAEDQRALMLDYYLDEKKAKIDLRRELAKELNLTANALRLRAHRLRASLEDCVLKCLGSSET